MCKKPGLEHLLLAERNSIFGKIWVQYRIHKLYFIDIVVPIPRACCFLHVRRTLSNDCFDTFKNMLRNAKQIILDMLSFFYNLWHVQYAIILPPDNQIMPAFISLHYPFSCLSPSSKYDHHYRISLNNSWGDYFFFAQKRVIIRGKVIF